MENKKPIIDITDFPVMPAKCKTCPFRVNDEGRHPCPELVSQIQAQVITEASQICHHPSVYGKEQTHICRGARDYQLEIFYRLGMIDSPTDEAWKQQSLKKEKA